MSEPPLYRVECRDGDCYYVIGPDDEVVAGAVELQVAERMAATYNRPPDQED